MAIIYRGHSSEESISFLGVHSKFSSRSSPAVSWNPVFPYYGLGWFCSRGVYMALFPGLACCWFSFMDFVCLCNRLPYGIARNNFSFGKKQFLIPSFPDFEGFVSWCPSWDFIVLSVFGTVVSPVFLGVACLLAVFLCFSELILI